MPKKLKEFISFSENETENIAADFSKELSKGNVIAMCGGMGAGKTAFVRGLVRGLGLDAEVSSPTFAIINEYNSIKNGRIFNIYHYDMYRIEDPNDLYSANYFEYLDDLPLLGIMIIEWSEKIADCLPNNAIYINMEIISENKRKIIIKGDNSENIGC